ncbi:MAG: beta-ketoacyl-ACP synthase [Spirochaetaceae bacterium]|jgi:3-oxoacyl-[acyl-carrier-protein] synthase II|nr:beta-ketoacyl-ACP synthase [Spirochaetaceae bacterium]
MQTEKRRVVVTGGGVVSVLGNSWQKILKSLKEGKNFVRYMNDWDKYANMNTRLATPVECELHEYPRKKIRGMGRVGRLAIDAVDDALAIAGIAEDDPILKNGRCGIAFGSSMGSVAAIIDFYDMIKLFDTKNISATTYIRSMPQTCAANIGVFYSLTGRLISTNTACTSGSMAIGFAYEAIQQGLQDIMIAGGADELTPLHAAVFDTLFAASCKNDTPSLTPRAFDKNRDGLVIGEGAGALILEEYENAVKRGSHIYAEVVGFGTNTDGSHITQPNKETMGGAISLALESAKLKADQISYVNMHGTATNQGDIAESYAAYDIFKRAVPVSTLKNYTGHTLGACGATEAWVSINMMNENWFAPNINLTEIDDKCAPLDYIMGSGRNINASYIMSNNFAFGGINTSLIFKRAS